MSRLVRIAVVGGPGEKGQRSELEELDRVRVRFAGARKSIRRQGSPVDLAAILPLAATFSRASWGIDFLLCPTIDREGSPNGLPPGYFLEELEEWGPDLVLHTSPGGSPAAYEIPNSFAFSQFTTAEAEAFLEGVAARIAEEERIRPESVPRGRPVGDIDSAGPGTPGEPPSPPAGGEAAS